MADPKVIAALKNLDPEALAALAALTQQVEGEKEAAASSQQVAQDLAEAQGLSPTKGRVYLSEEAITTAARVVNSGQPEVVAADGGRATHILLWRADNGEVAVQNYYQGK